MYLNTLFKLVGGQLADSTIELPVPIVIAFNADECKVLMYQGEVDNRKLNLSLASFEAVVERVGEISKLSERVGGVLNGTEIELGIQEIEVNGDRVSIPFFALEGHYPLGAVNGGSLKIEII